MPTAAQKAVSWASLTFDAKTVIQLIAILATVVWTFFDLREKFTSQISDLSAHMTVVNSSLTDLKQESKDRFDALWAALGEIGKGQRRR